MQVKQRAHLNGLGLQAHVGTLTYTDLSTPYPELQRVIHGAHPLPGGQLLSLALETEPLHSNAAIHADARLEHIEVRFHPRVAASILAYFYAARRSMGCRSRGLPSPMGFLRVNRRSNLECGAICMCTWRLNTPCLIALSVAPPTLLWIEPPKATTSHHHTLHHHY